MSTERGKFIKVLSKSYRGNTRNKKGSGVEITIAWNSSQLLFNKNCIEIHKYFCLNI
jgi:hypothetical protein